MMMQIQLKSNQLVLQVSEVTVPPIKRLINKIADLEAAPGHRLVSYEVSALSIYEHPD